MNEVATVADETTNIAPAGEFDAFKAARKDGKPVPALGVVAEPEEPALEAKKPDGKAWETWTDPETGEVFKEPSRRATRIRALHDQRESEKTARVKAETELAALKAERQPAKEPEPVTQPDPVVAKQTADDLTKAAEARIRTKPDRRQIGTETYPSVEDYTDDMAIWGGELAMAKRDVVAEHQTQQQQVQTARQRYAGSVQAAKDAHGDYEAIVKPDLQINQAIWETVQLIDNGGELLYQLVKQHELARIAALPSGPAHVALGKFLAKLETPADVKTPIAEAKAEPKPPKLAEPITPVVTGAGKGNPVDLADIAETGNYEEYRRVRNQQVKDGRR